MCTCSVGIATGVNGTAGCVEAGSATATAEAAGAMSGMAGGVIGVTAGVTAGRAIGGAVTAVIRVWARAESSACAASIPSAERDAVAV